MVWLRYIYINKIYLDVVATAIFLSKSKYFPCYQVFSRLVSAQEKSELAQLNSVRSAHAQLTLSSAQLRSKRLRSRSAHAQLNPLNSRSAQLSSRSAQSAQLSSAQLSSRSAQLTLSSTRSAQLTLSSTRSAQLSFRICKQTTVHVEVRNYESGLMKLR